MSKGTQVVSGETDQRIREIGAELWADMQREQPSAFDKEYWVGKVLDATMEDASLKTDLFRLIDVLPALERAGQVSDHVREYLLQPDRELPKGLRSALKLASGAVLEHVGAAAIKRGVVEMAHRFIVGEDVDDAVPALRRLHDDGIGFTVDLLGEATLSHAEADSYQHRYVTLIDRLASQVKGWPKAPGLDRNHLGPIPLVNVSLKVTALEPHFDPVDPEGSVARASDRVRPILRCASEQGVFVNFDMEQWEDHGLTLDLFQQLLLEPALRTYPHFGVVVQAYAPAASDDIERLARLARERGAPITIRLVKGAYWDFEVIRSSQHGYPEPVYRDKAATDANFERLTGQLLDHMDDLLPAIGSHNLRSIAHALSEAEQRGLSAEAVEIQMLYGMAEPLRIALRKRGHRVRVYAPVGALLPGMAYLIRRLLENTSNESFLRLSYHEHADLDRLLGAPRAASGRVEVRGSMGIDAPFTNCAHLDFADRLERDAFADSLDRALDSIPFVVPVVAGEEPRKDGPTERHIYPGYRERVVTEFAAATREEAEEAVRRAANAWPEWRDTSLRERAEILERVAEGLEQDRNGLAAIQVHEVGKPWRDADADVTEAIDFCRYYARQAFYELGVQRLGDVLGEHNEGWYEGRGVAVVIAPWNFPLAILTGMTTAALVAGNTVIMKPAEQSTAVGYSLFRHLVAAGVPADVVHFVPGIGETIGKLLVEHRDVAQIAFTGSKEVGLGINRAAAATHPSQRQVKRVVCEMGGKNAILVDADADFDAAVVGIAQSAFGYAGQKCSACSRLLVVRSVFEPLVERLTAATASLHLGLASDPACQVPPVITPDACSRLLSLIDEPAPGAELVYKTDAPSLECFVPPTIFRVSDPKHRFMQEEFFGPILSVMPVDSFEHGLEVANATSFALTGGVYSRRPSHIDLATREFRVGNLYINRPCTGAMVGRQPFGGFNMSGAGTKAGGPGYLLNFADPRTVTENTLRRGFSPDVSS